MPVTRGSFCILKRTPSASLCSCRSARRSSASMHIERNLKHWKAWPSRPIRIWRKRTGPPSSSLISNATTSMSGLKTSSAKPGADDVEQSLAPAACGVGLRRLDVHEREAGDRAKVDARTGNVGEARDHDEVDVRAFQLPAHAAEVCRRRERAARDQHGVGAGGLADAARLVGRPHDRHGHVIGVAHQVVGHARTDDLVADIALSVQHVDELVDRAGTTDRDHAVQETACAGGADARSCERHTVRAAAVGSRPRRSAPRSRGRGCCRGGSSPSRPCRPSGTTRAERS